jgi:hypothetical protein
MLEQMAWDASVMPVLAETDAGVMFMAMGAETTGQSRWPSSTGGGTDMHSSTLVLQDDEAVSHSPGSGMAQPLANEDRSDIVRIGQPAVRWGQGIPIRPLTTTPSLPGSVPSRAATGPTIQSSATPAARTLSYAAPPDTTSRPILPLGIETPTSSALSSVSDAITRLQRERDLALRRIEELHVYYTNERTSLEEARGRRESTFSNNFTKVSGDLELTKQQLGQETASGTGRGS